MYFLLEPGKIDPTPDVRVNATDPATLTCHIHGFPLTNFTWIKGNNSESIEHLASQSNVSKINETYYIMSLNFSRAIRNDNGTYSCSANDYNGPVYKLRNLFVIDVPQLSIDFMKAVGADKIFLNWTVNDGNMPIQTYMVRIRQNSTNDWQYYRENINGKYTSYVLVGFEKSTVYQISLQAKNAIGESQIYSDQRLIKTLEQDPIFVPTVSLTGSTTTSITLGWTGPPTELREHVHFYNLMIIHGNQRKEAVDSAQVFNDHVFVDLNPATTYQFKIAACSYYTKQCGNWSAEVNGTTLDGICSAPQNFTVSCRFDNISKTSFVSVSWKAPAVLNGIITHYKLYLSGTSQYRNERARIHVDHWGPVDHSAKVNDSNWEFKRVPSNTNYSAHIYGVTRLRSPGERITGNCSMPGTVPERENLNMRTWRKIENEGRHLFKLYLPRISERNGPICCYRVFLVKLAPQQTSADLPPPEEMDIYTYHYAHGSSAGGAYLAEIFESERLQPEVFLGDGRTMFNSSKNCDACIGLRPKPSPTLQLIPDVPLVINSTSTPTISSSTQATVVSVTIANANASVDVTNATELNSATTPAARHRRDNSGERMDSESAESSQYPPEDGFLDEKFNYTAFVEVTGM